MSEQEQPKKIRITNLTDIQSAELDRYGMKETTIAITTELLNPGESKEFEDTPQVRRDLDSYARVGAACEGDTPAAYRTAKDKAKKAPKQEATQQKKTENKDEEK